MSNVGPCRTSMKLLVDTCVFIDSFDPGSPTHADALRLLEELLRRELIITMPAHGWFEVQCTMQRLVKEKRFAAPTIAGRREYPIRLPHIDKPFIEKYAFTDLPYLRAGDHIFVAVAKVNSCRLVTSDAGMTQVSKQCGVQVFSPSEFLSELARVV
jgi:predicted nucleic acid-binding protein